jgi:hypothetical protein
MSAPDSANRPSSRFAALALCLALFSAASMLDFYWHLFIPNVLEARAAKGLGHGYALGDDFYPIWLTTRQWQLAHHDPYSPQMTREIQTGLFGRPLDARNPSDPPTDYREFAYPAFTDILFWPAAALEFPQLRLVLAVVLPLLTAASVWLWMLALQWRIHPLWFAVLVMLALCNYPVLEALFAEQPGLIVGFLLAGSMLALRQNRLLLAGVLLSLTLIKPQMTLLAAAYLLLWSLAERRRFRFAAGFLATTLLLTCASLWIWPHWTGQWLRVLLGYHRYATPPLVTLLPGPSLGAYLGPVAIVCLIGVAAGLAWRNRDARSDSPDFWLTLSLLLAITSVTLLPGQAVYDHVILIPGILLLLRHRRELRAAGRVPRTLLVVGAVVLSWQWMAAFAVFMAHSWLTSTQFAPILSLPIRTAASLPFAVLALLACATRITLPGRRELF